MDAPQFRSKHDSYNGHFILPSTRFPAQNMAVLQLVWSRSNGQCIYIYFTITLYKNTPKKSTQYVCTLDHPVLKNPYIGHLRGNTLCIYFTITLTLCIYFTITLYKNTPKKSTQYVCTLNHPVLKNPYIGHLRGDTLCIYFTTPCIKIAEHRQSNMDLLYNHPP